MCAFRIREIQEHKLKHVLRTFKLAAALPGFTPAPARLLRARFLPHPWPYCPRPRHRQAQEPEGDTLRSRSRRSRRSSTSRKHLFSQFPSVRPFSSSSCRRRSRHRASAEASRKIFSSACGNTTDCRDIAALHHHACALRACAAAVRRTIGCRTPATTATTDAAWETSGVRIRSGNIFAVEQNHLLAFRLAAPRSIRATLLAQRLTVGPANRAARHRTGLFHATARYIAPLSRCV